jgi:hypothetical protein
MGIVMSADDRIGSFGWFTVDRELTATAESRLFVVRHRPAHRAYFIRLSDEELHNWRGDPHRVSLHNAAVELANVRAVAASTSRLYSAHSLRRDRPAHGASIVIPQYYGVLNDRYLVPVSAVYRRRGAVPFESVLDTPGSLMRIFPFWENLWLFLVAETSLLAGGSLTFEQWRGRWAHLIAGSALGQQLVRDMPEDLSGRLSAAIVDMAAGENADDGPSLEDSAVFRLIIAYAGRRLREEDVAASLSCPFFRMNVTLRDLHYAVALRGLVVPRPWLFQQPLEWLGPSILVLPDILDALVEQPSSFPDDGDDFEPAQPPDGSTLGRFTLFLQDPDQTNRPYLALGRS